MDIARTKKKTVNIKKFAGLLILFGMLIFGGRYIMILSQADFGVDGETLVFGEVTRGDFTVSVRGSGMMTPDKIRWLSANVEANVVSLAVKAGNYVKIGDPIVELSNPQLLQRLAEAQWELEAETAELVASKVEQESTLLTQQAVILNAQLDYDSIRLEYLAQTELINIGSVGAVPMITYKKTGLETELFRERLQISKKQFTKMKENLVAQSNARTARMNQTKNRLERIQQQVDDLFVKATMNSIVLEMPLEPGNVFK